MSFFKSEIAQFLIKVLVIYIIWYIVYELWVLPSGVIDEPLSQNIASITAGILAAFGETTFHFGRVVGITGTNGVEIVDGCNGIAAIGLFLGFIIAYPGAWIPRLLFSLFGIAVIYITNVARTVILCYVQAYWPTAFDFTHEYSTAAVFYIIIFILWMIWANYGDSFQSRLSSEKPVSASGV